MQNNTRIYPTVNGLPHLGHLYLALVNQHYARATGGTLSIIFDDTQPWWLERVGKEQMRRNSDAWISDMAWMGITFDEKIYQSEGRGWLRLELNRLGYDGDAERPDFPYFPRIIGNDATPYPWDDFLTVEKVFFDHRAEVTMLIRGEDLISEYALYQSTWSKYITRNGGPKPPEHIYLPRLLHAGGQLASVSKTEGTFTIATFRERGWEPEEIAALLRHCCLSDPAGQWSFENIVNQPMLHNPEPMTSWLGYQHGSLY